MYGLVKNLVDSETYEMYEGIIDINCNEYAEYIATGMIYSFKKSKKCFREDKIGIKINHLIYKFNSFFNPERIDKKFENQFFKVKQFINEFQNILKEFRIILENEINNPEVVAELYLYYFAILEIYTKVFKCFDDNLKIETLRASDINMQIPVDKNIDDNLKDFNDISKLIRSIKKEGNN